MITFNTELALKLSANTYPTDLLTFHLLLSGPSTGIFHTLATVSIKRQRKLDEALIQGVDAASLSVSDITKAIVSFIKYLNTAKPGISITRGLLALLRMNPLYNKPAQHDHPNTATPITTEIMCK